MRPRPTDGSAASQVMLYPIDEQTDNALAAAERAFRLELMNISRAALASAGLNPADGWRLNLQPNTPGYRQFIRLMSKPEEVEGLPENGSVT